MGTRILDAAGSPHEESLWVAESLVDANLAGHDSHGIMRVALYVERINNGQVKPGAPVSTVRETAATAVIDGHQGWGQVLAKRGMEMAIEKARSASVGSVAVRNAGHAGRMGKWVTMAAQENMIGLSYVNSRGALGEMFPWGGAERRLNLNAMAFAAPSGTDCPVLVDVSLSVAAGGKIIQAALAGQQLPEGYLIDAEGNPTTDPADFDGPPPGAVLPIGGVVGHKGYAMNVMADLMAGALAATGVSGQKTPRGNGLFFQAVNIEAFLPVSQYTATVQEYRTWIKSARKEPGTDEIFFPGEIEYRTAQRRRKEGISIPEGVWKEVLETAKKVGVSDT